MSAPTGNIGAVAQHYNACPAHWGPGSHPQSHGNELTENQQRRRLHKGGVSEDASSLSFPSELLSRSGILCRRFRHHWPRSELGWQEPDTWSVRGSTNQECEPLGTPQGAGQSDFWVSVSLTLLQPPRGFLGRQGQWV